jgi:RNA polymerase sigma factor (sigma-70 family)
MTEERFDPATLSQINTSWTLLRQAHEGPPDVAARAHEVLAGRYQRAVTRYLERLGCTPDLAAEVTQRFFLGLLRGELRGADPERGRFRALLKTAVRHLLSKERRAAGRRPLPVQPDADLLARVPALTDEEDESFDEAWRGELMARTWEALARANPRYYQILRLRAEQPRLPSHRMGEHLPATEEEPLSGAAVRKALERARDRFGVLLIEEVAHSVDPPTPERIAEELADLRLLKYCAGLLPADVLRPGTASA